ncbi:MAG: hypothetical protein V2G33_07270 [bacterium JZ-2024 1]
MVLCGGMWMGGQGWASSGPSEKPADTSSRQVEGFYPGCRWIASPKDIPVPQEKIKEWENLLDRVKMTDKGRREFMIQLWTLTYQSEQFRKGKMKAQRRISQKRGNGITPGAVNPAPSGFAELSSISAEKLCCGQIAGVKQESTCGCCTQSPPCECSEIHYVESEPVELRGKGRDGVSQGVCGCSTLSCTCEVNWEDWKCEAKQKFFKDCVAGVQEEEKYFWNFTATRKFKCNELECSHWEGGQSEPACPYDSSHCVDRWGFCAEPCCTPEQCRGGNCDCRPGEEWNTTCDPVVAPLCYIFPTLCWRLLKVDKPAYSAGCLPTSCGP